VKYRVDTDTGCWVWNGRVNRKGYGILHVARPGYRARDEYAHRWMYEQHVGPIPEGLVLDHLCRNPPCVNPEHVELVTHVENLRRGKGTKLTAHDVEQMRSRREAGETCRAIAASYGISESHVSRVTRGIYWSDTPRPNPSHKRGPAVPLAPRKKKTHCPRGHPFDEANTYVGRGGGRTCRICRREHQRRFYNAKKAAA
jgi:hypothetical protein